MIAFPGTALIQAQEPDDICHNYKHGAAKVLGILQIVLGILIIIFKAALLLSIVFAKAGQIALSIGTIAALLVILAGVFGVRSSRTKSTCSVTATMVLSILASVICFVVFMEGASLCIGTALDTEHIIPQKEKNLVGGLLGTITCLALVEAIVAIVASAFCCQARCCGRLPGVPFSTVRAIHHPHEIYAYTPLKGSKEES